MKMQHWLILAGMAFCLSSCFEMDAMEGSESGRNWAPETASMADHISTVHAFKISPDPDSDLRVVMDPEGTIKVEFRPEVLEKLGGEKILSYFGWESNPHRFSRSDYLFFLEGLHAMLAMNAAE